MIKVFVINNARFYCYCEYEIKITKMESFINGKLEPSPSDDEIDSDSNSDMISISSRFSLYIFFLIQ